ncbi:MAG: TIM barrel protein, partial [Planctomycetota bacterium]
AHQGSEDDLMETVLERLSIAMNDLSVDGSDLSGLRLALELEPGPIYLLRNQETLEKLAAKIDSYDCQLVRSYVGFNLDVAHWWLADKITAKWLDEDASEQLRSRIYHSHISGHSHRGHFGDYSLARIPSGQAVDFRGWLRAITRLSTVDHVSLEYEAAPSQRDVVESVQALNRWLRRLEKETST